MDGEILSDRLAATEDAVIKLDERLDEVEGEEPQSDAVQTHETRILLLEEKLTECLMKLQTYETERTEAAEAKAIAEEAKEAAVAAEALAIVAMAQEPEETEEEPSLETEVQEVEPEPESEGDQSEPRRTWWESFLTLR